MSRTRDSLPDSKSKAESHHVRRVHMQTFSVSYACSNGKGLNNLSAFYIPSVPKMDRFQKFVTRL